MSNRFNLTDEEISGVLLSSPYTLPSSPAQKGLGESQIKKYFYNFIVLLCEKLNLHFSDIGEAVSELLSKIDASDLALAQKAEALGKEIVSSVASHNGEATAHADIRELISQTAEEICESIAQGIDEHNSSLDVHRSLKELTVQSIDEHNNSSDVHQALLELISKAQETADSAHNLASGKSKVYPVRSIAEMDNLLSSAYTDCFVGDVFVIAEKDVPDFTVYERETEAQDGDISFSQFDLLMGMEFTPGNIYYAVSSKTRLIASESGMDTSLLATKTELDSISMLVSSELKYKQDKLTAGDNITISNDGTISATDCTVKVVTFKNNWSICTENNTVYVATEPINNLTITYPSENFVSVIEFTLASEGDIYIEFPPESRFMGEMPTFANGEAWELNIRNGVIVGGIIG